MSKDDLIQWIRLKGLRRYKDDLGGAEKKTGAFAKASAGFSNKVKMGWVAVGVALAASSAASVVSFVKLEHKMTEVWTLLDVGKDKMDELTVGIQELSKEIPQSAQEMAGGLYDLISAGVDVEEGLNALALSSKAAVAGVTDTATAVRAGMATLNAYGMEITELERVFDLQFSTVQKGVTTFEQLAGAIGNALPVAAMLKMSMEDLFGSIAFLTKAGQSTDIAVTNLNAMLNAFVQYKDQMADFGVMVFDASGNIRPLVDIMNDINDATAGTVEHQMEMLRAMGLADRRTQKAVGGMLANMNGLRSTLRDVADSTRALGGAFGKAASDSQSAFTMLASSARTFGEMVAKPFVALGKAMTGPLGEFFDFLSLPMTIGRENQQIARTQAAWATIMKEAQQVLDTAEVIDYSGIKSLEVVESLLADMAGHIGTFTELSAVFGKVPSRKADLATLTAAINQLKKETEEVESMHKTMTAIEGQIKGLSVIQRLNKLLFEGAPGAAPGLELWGKEGLEKTIREGYAALPDWDERRGKEIAPPVYDPGLERLGENLLMLEDRARGVKEEIAGNMVAAMEGFAVAVVTDADRAREAFHRMIRGMIADIVALLARMVLLKAVAAVFGQGIAMAIGGGQFVPGFVGGIGSGGGRVGAGTGALGPTMGMPPAPDTAGITVVVHEATPRTWAEITDKHIYPRTQYLERERVTER